MTSRLLITGGAGFIGSEFVRQHAAANPIVVDKLTYAGDRQRLHTARNNITFYKADISNKARLRAIFAKERPRQVIHFAAQTHVDRSLKDNHPFIAANITGTQNLVDLSREFKIKRFVHISSDEVYGESTHKRSRFRETAALQPGNPYAATKAAAEFIVSSAVRSFDFPAIIVRPSNNYGPWQYPEKFVPVVILKALHDHKVPIYGRGKQIREWLHVSDCVRGITTVLKEGKIGEAYNIGSYTEYPNIVTAGAILKHMKRSSQLIKFIPDRPGHDYRYGVDCTKVRKLGWKPQIRFDSGIRDTIRWYEEHLPWFDKKSQIIKKYWATAYGKL